MFSCFDDGPNNATLLVLVLVLAKGGSSRALRADILIFGRPSHTYDNDDKDDNDDYNVDYDD